MSVNPRRYGDGRLIIQLLINTANLTDLLISYALVAKETEIYAGKKEKIKNNFTKSIEELRADNIVLAVELLRRLYNRDGRLITDLIVKTMKLTYLKIGYGLVIKEEAIYAGLREDIKKNFARTIGQLGPDCTALAVELFRRLYLRNLKKKKLTKKIKRS